MRYIRISFLPVLVLFSALIVWGCREVQSALPPERQSYASINGVSFTAPSRPITADRMKSMDLVNTGWVSVIPYAFCRPGQTMVGYNYPGQWWGEGPEGIRAQVGFCRQYGWKVMVKPQLWVIGQGWAGDFDLETAQNWAEWEKNYTKYILEYANLAEELEVEMFCLGTEIRQSVKQRPGFWQDLIIKVRQVYSGKLTYAANWDNYQNVKFWSELDYIGVDAYFPLSDASTPEVKDLKSKWQKDKDELESISLSSKKKVIFTEYGYMSIDHAAWRNWELESNQNSFNANMQAQQNAYEAFFQTFWKEPWFNGGFLWKWHEAHESAGGSSDKRYTPQNKPVMSTIADWYGRSEGQN